MNYSTKTPNIRLGYNSDALNDFIEYFSTKYPNVEGQDIFDLIRVAQLIFRQGCGLTFEEIDSIIFNHVGN